MKSFLGIAIVPHPPIIIPEVGEGREKKAEKTISGMNKIAEIVKGKAPEVIVCITPHGNVFSDGICILNEETAEGNLAIFGKPDVRIKKKIDIELNNALIDLFLENKILSIFLDNNLAKKYGAEIKIDHGCLVPLYYIDKYYKNYKIVHVTVGMVEMMELYKTGKVIRDAIEKTGKKGLILASGDLSHCLKKEGPYEYNEKGEVFDKTVLDLLKQKNYTGIVYMPSSVYEPAAQCGLRPIAMALGAADGYESSVEVFSYEGPFGVGYMTAVIELHEKSKKSLISGYEEQREAEYEERKKQEDEYITLARTAIEKWIKLREKTDWSSYKRTIKNKEALKSMENNKAGTFVSIHKKGELRGCIGTISASQNNIAEEIIVNAIHAAAEDPRFAPVKESELKELQIKVDILGNKEAIKKTDELDVKKYGVIVESGRKRGLLLPNLEGIDTVEEQVAIAKRKAGIYDNEPVKLYRFEVKRHE